MTYQERLELYEQRKKQLWRETETHEEYEKKLRELIDKLKI